MMSLGEPEGSYSLANHEHPPTFESVAILLVSAHTAKYDLVSLMCVAMEEVAAMTAANQPESKPKWIEEGSPAWTRTANEAALACVKIEQRQNCGAATANGNRCLRCDP